MPTLEKTGFTESKNDPKVVEQRKSLLSDFLNFLLSHTFDSTSFRRFLLPNENFVRQTGYFDPYIKKASQSISYVYNITLDKKRVDTSKFTLMDVKMTYEELKRIKKDYSDLKQTLSDFVRTQEEQERQYGDLWRCLNSLVTEPSEHPQTENTAEVDDMQIVESEIPNLDLLTKLSQNKGVPEQIALN